MKNLNLAESMDHSDYNWNFSRNTAVEFTTRNGDVSNNVHQVSVIIIDATEHNDGMDNIVVSTQGNNPRNNCRKEK
jgi:hypothetical protein